MSEFKFLPGKTYELLLKQANAMQLLIRSLEKQKAFQNVSMAEMARELALQGFEEINAQRDINEKLTNEIMALEAERDALKAEKEMQQSRGDNHWETLRSIRDIAKTSGDIQRIIQWVNDAGGGYTESNEATMAKLMDQIVELKAEPEKLRFDADLSRHTIESLQSAYKHMTKLKDELLTELEAARKQEPPQQMKLPDDALYALDPLYDKGEYYISGADINDIIAKENGELCTK